MTGSGRLYRVLWSPGSDDLLGRCYCGAERVLTDPTAVWDWLLAHPDGHDGGGEDGAAGQEPPQTTEAVDSRRWMDWSGRR